MHLISRNVYINEIRQLVTRLLPHFLFLSFENLISDDEESKLEIHKTSGNPIKSCIILRNLVSSCHRIRMFLFCHLVSSSLERGLPC